jgi:CBS-domain-containing membrane protein
MRLGKSPNENEQDEMVNQVDFMIRELQETLIEIDNTLDVDTPDISWFNHLTEEAKKQANSRLIHDLLKFWAAAVGILSIVLYTTTTQPAIYGSLTVISLVVALVLLPKISKSKGAMDGK